MCNFRSNLSARSSYHSAGGFEYEENNDLDYPSNFSTIQSNDSKAIKNWTDREIVVTKLTSAPNQSDDGKEAKVRTSTTTTTLIELL